MKLYPLSVTLVEKKLEFCWNYDSGPLCCAKLSVSLRGLQKCSFSSVTLHTTHANFNIDLGSPISFSTGFFFFFCYNYGFILLLLICIISALVLLSSVQGQRNFSCPKEIKAEEESGSKLPKMRQLASDHLAFRGELSSPGF